MGEAALVSGTMRFLGVLLVDRAPTSAWGCDLPGVVLRGLFPGRRWLQLRYDLAPRQAFWHRQSAGVIYLSPSGPRARHHCTPQCRDSPFVIRPFAHSPILLWLVSPGACAIMEI